MGLQCGAIVSLISELKHEMCGNISKSKERIVRKGL